jgi:acetolactate synthase-1/2/3 large subunit
VQADPAEGPTTTLESLEMNAPPRGADVLVQTLQMAGVRCIFSLSGNHIMPVYDALNGSGIRLIHTRHEAATVHMADAWARLTGEVGIALVTGGPGHANAVSALYTALMAEAPLVLLSGHAPNNQLGRGAFQEMRQADMAAPVCKASWTCASTAALAGDLARAIRLARSGRPGPVHLSLPSDVLEGLAGTGASMPTPAEFSTVAMPPAPDTAASALELLQQAKRPLILAGPACMTRSGRAALSALEAACGIPVVGMESPRGVGDPALGAFSEMLAAADTVLLLGKRLDFTLKFGQAPAFRADTQWLQVDADAEEIERSRRAVGERLRLAVQADAASMIAALRDTARALPAQAAWLADVRRAIAFRPAAWDEARSGAAGTLHPVQALRPLQALLDSHPDAVFVCDGGEIGQWAQACLSAPHRVINGVAGSIGAGLSFALAARCALPDAPVVAVMGDGTFGFHLAEIDTAMRYGLPTLTVVGNDARWNAEYQIQLKDYGAERLIGCELRPMRYDLVTAGFGGHGELVTRAEDLMPAAQRALASGLPACLNVMLEGLAAPTVRMGAGAAAAGGHA